MMAHESWLQDTGAVCAYDSECIEYADPVVLLAIVLPKVDQNGVMTFNYILTPNGGDFLYDPVYFLSPNWDRVEEDMQANLEEREAIPCKDPILTCCLCSSGILVDETTGLLTPGAFERSQRNPDGNYGRKFIPDRGERAVVCIACLRAMNDEVLTIWDDGVCHKNECPDGTQTRCWRAGCAGGCDQDEESEE